ncbi:hypothetical protein OHV05_08885 [Kitasatospora sp. NBC_00070]|uniref:hypothetical protein n=1 Tax=Kitasatospora sp. NBC_00070 TaxID=2975962 RepID=UPI003250B091
MAFVMSALLVLAAVAVWVGNRLHSYPGGWACAFGRAYAAERAGLAAGRRRVREVEHDRARERSAAEREIRATEAEYRRRITELQDRVAELAEDDCLLHRDDRADRARRALALARSDTIPQQTARADRDLLLEQQREDRTLREARAELTAAHLRWQRSTGHRPG